MVTPRKQPTVPVEQMSTAYQAMMQRMEAKAKAAFDKAATENKTKSDAFLAQNRTKPGVKTLPSGVQYRVLETGNGRQADDGQHGRPGSRRAVSVGRASGTRHSPRRRPRA